MFKDYNKHKEVWGRMGKNKHKEVWGRMGKDFYIEVVRWESMTAEEYESMRERGMAFNGRFIWNIYCYLYPDHPRFNLAKEEDMCDCPINSFHYGCTYAKRNRSIDGTVICKRYGNDYNHYGDDHFTYIEKPEDAFQIFSDADELFEELS